MSKSKKSDLKVATWDDDGTTRIVSLSEFYGQFKPIEYRGADWLIAQLKKNGKVTFRSVLELLAVIKRAHEVDNKRDGNGKLPDVAIPFELIDVIGSTITGKVRWQKIQTKDRKMHGAAHKLSLKTEAEKIREGNSHLSNIRIAEIIAKKHGGSVDYIRRVISKK
jgi:hypothetical protein